MSDFAPSREAIEEVLDFPVLISKADDGVTEQRRLRDSNSVIGWRVKTPPLTYAQLTTYRDFFLTKYGPLVAFTFTSPFDEEEYTVRFEPGTMRISYERGVYMMQFELKRMV